MRRDKQEKYLCAKKKLFCHNYLRRLHASATCVTGLKDSHEQSSLNIKLIPATSRPGSPLYFYLILTLSLATVYRLVDCLTRTGSLNSVSIHTLRIGLCKSMKETSKERYSKETLKERYSNGALKARYSALLIFMKWSNECGSHALCVIASHRCWFRSENGRPTLPGIISD